MKTADHQSEVFNRTKRIEIPGSCVRRDVAPGMIKFGGLHQGDWSKQIDPKDLSESILYVDIRSLLMLNRIEVQDPASTLDAAWAGQAIPAMAELTNGDYRVRMQVSIAFPSGHADAGRILARSPELVLVEGPDTDDGSGSSLLPVRPAIDDMSALWRLDINESTGPAVYVNSNISGISWRELASEPKFRFAIFTACIREILRYLVFHSSCRETWGAAWLRLDGIRGRDIPEIDDLSAFDAWNDVCAFVETAGEGFVEQLNLAGRLGEQICASGAADT